MQTALAEVAKGASETGNTLSQLTTPCLIVDEARMNANIARLRSRLERAGVGFRPHLKTAKSVEISRRMITSDNGPATVSTLREAEVFAAAGITDLTYAVGVSPCKLQRVGALLRQGVQLSVILDSVEQAEAVAAYGAQEIPVPVLIELDCDGHRSGVRPQEHARLLAIAEKLPPASLRGVLTHAGESYHAKSRGELETAAENERVCAVNAACVLRSAGHACPVVSVGSTPTAHFAASYEGVTEVRAGVFVFFDLVQAGIGVCGIGDIALSVLATVIGHQREKGWIIVDAGWTALSGDRGTAVQKVDQGYGLVCDMLGNPLGDLVVAGTNQEHGVIALRKGAKGSLPDIPVGACLRILPNHACATATQHDFYHVVSDGGESIVAHWPRFHGW